MHMGQRVCSGSAMKNGDPKILHLGKFCNPPYPEKPIRGTGGKGTSNPTTMKKKYIDDLLFLIVPQCP